MNLNEEPTQAQLMRLIAECDDSFNHVVWVSKEGEVRVQALKPDESAALWAIKNDKEIQFRVELISAGQGRVGVKGSLDKNWIARLYQTLETNWENRTTGYVGLFK